MNLPAAGRLSTRRTTRRVGSGARAQTASLVAACIRRPALTALVVGLAITASSALLEALNPRNYWLLFEDISCVVAPGAAAIAVAMAAAEGSLEHRPARLGLASSLGLTATGQVVAAIPDLVHRTLAPLSAVSNVCYVVGAVLGVSTLAVTLYRQLEKESRRTVLLDGLVITAAAMTFVFANWLHENTLPGGQAASPADPTVSLLLPLVSALFFASAAAVVVTALTLRIAPSRRGVWAVTIGIVLLAVAWEGWIARFLSGAPDGIEPMDFIFPAGALALGYGGVTWTLARGDGRRYERLARAASDWLPIVAIVGCTALDVMPRSRPLDVDPIAVGTCAVVLLAVLRQRILQNRERLASERLTTEMSDRAATTVSLARLEATPTIEGTAGRICSEALRIDGIDTVVLFAFSPHRRRAHRRCRPDVPARDGGRANSRRQRP